MNPPPKPSLLTALGSDLKNPTWMYVKAVLFLLAGIISIATLLFDAPTLRNAFLLLIAIWSFCRLYYFVFYVIEKYIDPTYRFDSIYSALKYLLRRR